METAAIELQIKNAIDEHEQQRHVELEKDVRELTAQLRSDLAWRKGVVYAMAAIFFIIQLAQMIVGIYKDVH